MKFALHYFTPSTFQLRVSARIYVATTVKQHATGSRNFMAKLLETTPDLNPVLDNISLLRQRPL